MEKTSTPLVCVTQLNKWYGTRQVLRNVSLEVTPHERVIICGASGSGNRRCSASSMGWSRISRDGWWSTKPN